MLNKPLKPSIRLEPLIINKKHKLINISEKNQFLKDGLKIVTQIFLHKIY